MTLDVVNGKNEKVGAVDLNDAVFGGTIKTDLVWASVVRQNASERAGTHATKNRALVSGGGKKPYKQKGTGRAQAGSSRSPLWRKGGTVFGPQPRSYAYQLPKKVEKGALRAALITKTQGGDLKVVDALTASAVLVGLVLAAQFAAMPRLLRDPKRYAPWYNGVGVTLYVLGMLAAALGLGGYI